MKVQGLMPIRNRVTYANAVPEKQGTFFCPPSNSSTYAFLVIIFVIILSMNYYDLLVHS